MKLKNKLLACLLVLAMCVCLLAGCGGGTEEDKAGKAETESGNQEESQPAGDKVLR